jgi:trehalose 6-phosphate synthase
LSRLVVVSNRVALPQDGSTGGEGGLAVAVRAALLEAGGLWFGWSGELSPRKATKPKVSTHDNVSYALIDLTQRDYDEYYSGYANGVLWPLFHYRMDLADFSRREMAGYLRTNALFAEHLLPLLRPDDIVWVHDYQLMPLGKIMRDEGCRQRIGFFLHIPWPCCEVFVALPNHLSIVETLFDYDVIGFQTETDLHNFHEYITREVGGRVEGDVVSAFGKTVRARDFPIGIDTDVVSRLAKETEDSRPTIRLHESINKRKLVIGVDRLDYSKGLVQRLESLEFLLLNYPETRRNFVMLQITPRSREDVEDYKDIRSELEEMAGNVNGSFAEFDWMPVRYLSKGVRRPVLMGFLRISSVGLVTPLRDGMNLVAKEYIAAQDKEDPGVLILSRFAGAARELPQALIVNPYDIEGVGDALHRALSMPLEERRERWSAMYEHLLRNDVTTWRKSFLSELSKTPVPA